MLTEKMVKLINSLNKEGFTTSIRFDIETVINVEMDNEYVIRIKARSDKTEDIWILYKSASEKVVSEIKCRLGCEDEDIWCERPILKENRMELEFKYDVSNEDEEIIETGIETVYQSDLKRLINIINKYYKI